MSTLTDLEAQIAALQEKAAALREGDPATVMADAVRELKVATEALRQERLRQPIMVPRVVPQPYPVYPRPWRRWNDYPYGVGAIWVGDLPRTPQYPTGTMITNGTNVMPSGSTVRCETSCSDAMPATAGYALFFGPEIGPLPEPGTLGTIT